MERTPRPNEIYQHFKGNLYKVITLAKHSETGETMVVYQALYGSFGVFVRPLALFTDEVDHKKYPEAAAKYRFTLVPEILGQGAASGPISHTDGSAVPMQGRDMTSRASAKEESPAAQKGAQREEQPSGLTAAEGNPASGTQSTPEEEGEASLDPMLLKFLDADTYEEKLDIFVGLHNRITHDMLNTMAVSLDLDLAEGDLEERYLTLKNCILTLEKYECNRLR